MKKIILLLSVFLLSGCSLLPAKKNAALKITSTPKSTVFIDGKHSGNTPFLNKQMETGEVTIKLIPESDGPDTTPLEGLVELSSGVVTIVNHEFATDTSSAAGEMLTLKPNNRSVASLSVVSQPDAAVVKLDGESKNFTPLVIDQVDPGDHQLTVSAPGYKERTIRIQTQTGYRLTASVQLGRETVPQPTESDTNSDQKTSEATDSAKTTIEDSENKTNTSKAKNTLPEKPYIKVNDTPTGWLRVRSEPTLNSKEITKINPGETYKLLNTQSGWYQIELKNENEETGWIAGQYAEKYE